MAQLKCIVCGKLITGDEQVCPSCGAWIIGQKNPAPAPDAPKEKTPSLKVLIGPFIALILVVAAVYVLSSMNNNEESVQTEQTTSDETTEEQAETEQTESIVTQPSAEKESSCPSVEGTYKGQIKTPTVIRLKQEGHRLYGTIRYTKFDSPALDINGSIESDGKFELTELDEEGRTPSGHIVGTIKGNTMTATFHNPKNDKSTDFTLSKEN